MKFKRFTLLFSLLITFGFISTACSFNRPQTLEETVQKAVEKHDVVGVVAYLKVDGQEPLTAVAGVADRENNTPLKLSDQFRIYSITKSFTAIVTLQLAEEGVLSLDDTIDQWLPEAVIGGLENTDRITIRQLLNHSSGIYDHLSSEMEGMPPFFQEALQSEAGLAKWYTPQELIDYSAQYPPYFAPGEGVAYSNTGYVILQLMIEKATGNSIDAEITRRIIEPLDLQNTYHETPETPFTYVNGYHDLGEGEILNTAGSNTSFSPASGALISNLEDLVRYTKALFNGELLQPESHEAMFTFTPDPNNDRKKNWVGHLFI